MPPDEKIIEHIVKKTAHGKYVENNNLLNKFQSAFRKGHSCETTLNNVVHDWSKAVEDGFFVIIVFLDLKRAFETVDRSKMIEKLREIGIDENEILWFINYLSKRKQKTKYGNSFSDEHEIPIGLPQGTALSVLLFILYINDIVYATQNSKVVMFADDTTLTIKAKNINEAISLMNDDLKRIFSWLNTNKLMLNVDKTKWMILHKKKIDVTNLTLKINKKEIERVSKIKYLGVILNDKLNLNDQIEKCIAKAAQKVNMLKRMSNKLTFDTKKIIYNTVIQPNFDYCSTLYLNTTKDQIINMQKIQNRGMRIILKCNYLTPKKFMLDALNWLSVAQRIRFNALVMIFKIKHGLVPQYLNDDVKYVHNIHSINLRNSQDFRIPKYKTNITTKSIFYEGMKLFNALPNEIKTINNLITFKKHCRTYVKKETTIY